MTSTTSSSTTEEDMEKLRASLREEVLGTKRLNDYFELRLLPTTQEYSVHCNPVSEKEYTGWILDRLMPKKSLSNDKIRVLKESEFTNTFHILHGNNNLKGKAVSTFILTITPSWEMSDVLQALTFSRKKVVIVETVEDVGKYLSEKDGEETIRINNLVFEKGKKTQ